MPDPVALILGGAVGPALRVVVAVAVGEDPMVKEGVTVSVAVPEGLAVGAPVALTVCVTVAVPV